MHEDVEEFNRQQSIKWKLPDAHTKDLVSELAKRDGVYSKKLGKGERLELYGPYTVLVVKP